MYGDDLNYDFTPSLDVWYHLVFTYENSGSFTKCIYVDGVLKKSGSGGKYAYSGSNKQLLIGRAYGPDVSTSRGFTGEMAYARGFTAALNSKGVEYLYSQKPDATGGVFKGLEYNEGSSTFLDGSIGHSSWYYAVGAFKEFKTRQFPGPTPDSVNLVKLWLKTDMKRMKNCANDYDLLYNRDGVIDRLAFIPTFSSSVPVLTQSWDTWYSSYAERGEKIRLGKPTFQKQDALYSIVFSNSAQPILPQSSAHAIPVIGNNVTRVRFDKSVSGDALSFASLISRVAFNPISVNAVEQMSDHGKRKGTRAVYRLRKFKPIVLTQMTRFTCTKERTFLIHRVDLKLGCRLVRVVRLSSTEMTKMLKGIQFATLEIQ